MAEIGRCVRVIAASLWDEAAIARLLVARIPNNVAGFNFRLGPHGDVSFFLTDLQLLLTYNLSTACSMPTVRGSLARVLSRPLSYGK